MKKKTLIYIMLAIVSALIYACGGGGGGESTANAVGVPANVTATAGNGQVTVTWDSVSGATSYNIYWSTTAGVTEATGTKITDVTSPYLHSGLQNDTTYYYAVTAVNGAGESALSAETSATPSINPPPPPPAAPGMN